MPRACRATGVLVRCRSVESVDPDLAAYPRLNAGCRMARIRGSLGAWTDSARLELQRASLPGRSDRPEGPSARLTGRSAATLRLLAERYPPRVEVVSMDRDPATPEPCCPDCPPDCC
jgi:hypothetical protein